MSCCVQIHCGIAANEYMMNPNCQCDRTLSSKAHNAASLYDEYHENETNGLQERK